MEVHDVSSFFNTCRYLSGHFYLMSLSLCFQKTSVVYTTDTAKTLCLEVEEVLIRFINMKHFCSLSWFRCIFLLFKKPCFLQEDIMTTILVACSHSVTLMMFSGNSSAAEIHSQISSVRQSFIKVYVYSFRLAEMLT